MGFLRAIALLGLLASAQAQVVISQIYGGGGNAGSTYTNDFIELLNTSNAPVSVAGWSVQYTSAAGTSWQVTNLSGTLQPGHYYLVQEAQGAGGTTPLPTPDAIGTIAMSATTGKVALVNLTTALSGACPAGASIVDFIGYGSPTPPSCFEGAGAAPGITNTTADLRGGGGCTDTNNNNADFASGAPTPRNSASPTNVCGSGTLQITNSSPLPNGTVGTPYSVTFTATGGSGTGYTFAQNGGTFPPPLTLNGATLSGTPSTTSGSPFSFTIRVTDSLSAFADKTFQLTIAGPQTCTPTHSIAQIQGSGTTSPFLGTQTTSGIVTGIKSNGFFMQMPAPGDGDATTSDGIFVFTSSAPPAAAALGNSVCVTGTVQEFIPSSDPNSPPQTEISGSPTIFAISTGNPLPAPVALTAADTNPAGAFSQLEKYEGMRVSVSALDVIAPTGGTITESSATSSSNGLFFGVISGIARPFREPGVQQPDPLPPNSPCCVTRFDANPQILQVDANGQTGAPIIDVTTGQTVSNLVGPLDYSRRAYTINPDPAIPATVSGSPMTFVAVPAPVATEFTVASFNMERFFDTVDDPGVSDVALTPAAFAMRLNKASLAIRNVQRYPDVVGVEEMENITTLQAVAAKVNNDAVAAGDPNPNYQAYLVEGNDVGGIDVGFLVKTPKVTVVDVTQYGLTTTYINPLNNMPELLNDRPPLVLRLTVAAVPGPGTVAVTVIVNHLRSLSAIDDPIDGPRVRAKREAQAEYLANLIQSFQQADPTVNIVSVGDYNSFQFSDGYADVVGVIKGTPVPVNQVVQPPQVITNPTLTDLVDTAAAAQQYSYTFSGSAQVLDHVLVNPNMYARLSRFAYARNDADFPEIYRNDANRPERISDHDMPVAYFTLSAAVNLTAQFTISNFAPSFNRTTQQWTQTVTVTNTGSALSNVAYVLDSLNAGWTLTNGNGTTVATTPSGSPYKIVGAVGAGSTVTFQLQFTRSGTPAFSYVPRVLDGTPR